jgi:hypothetical protein
MVLHNSKLDHQCLPCLEGLNVYDADRLQDLPSFDSL